MLSGLAGSCALTGFVPRHAMACVQVAERFNCIVMFREPGKAAQRLIAEGYAMKGFRIDTKSCTWGPMSGFVCMDPRLSKPKSDGASNTAFNEKYTKEALSGHVGASFVAPKGQDATDWVASVMPIAISRKRIEELNLGGRLEQDGSIAGVSTQAFGDGGVTLSWRLVPARNASTAWLIAPGVPLNDYFVLCVDTRVPAPFKQRYGPNVEPIMFRGNEAILGLTNPGTKGRGFMACVTADYDLFCVLPSMKDAMGAMNEVMGQITRINAFGHGGAVRPMAGGMTRLPNVDDRLRLTKTSPTAAFEHHKHGDVSARIMQIKTQLNGAIHGAGYKGGNAVHHNDEAGNEFLAKANLAECLPVICFLPSSAGAPDQVMTLETPADFKALYETIIANRFVYKGKKTWAKSAGATLTTADEGSGF